MRPGIDETLTVQGWVVGRDRSAYEVEIRAQRASRRAAPLGVRRPDVVSQVEGATHEACGFKVLLEAAGSGASRLDLDARLEGGTRIRLGAIDVKLRPDGASTHAPDSETPISWSVGAVGMVERASRCSSGETGWLFLRGDSNEVVGQHTGAVKLRKEAQHAWGRLLTERMVPPSGWVRPGSCSSRPTRSRFIPSTCRDACDLLSVGRFTTSWTWRAPCSRRSSACWTIFARRKRRAGSTREQTPIGTTAARMSHTDACAASSSDGESAFRRSTRATLRWSEESAPGDLGRKWYPAPIHSPVVRAEATERRRRLRSDNGIHNHGRVTIFEQDERVGPSCVIFGESFAEQILLFLKETFRRLCVRSSTSMLIEEVLEQERPDVVLSLPVERFLVRVPDDRDALAKLDSAARAKRGHLDPYTAV